MTDMETGNVFDFSGSIAMMRFTVKLLKKDFNYVDDIDHAGIPTSHVIDELQLQWQQKISLQSDRSVIENDTKRNEARLFTYVEGDKLPERLKVVVPPSDSDGMVQKIGYDKWMAHNAVVDLPTKRNHRTIRCDKKLMYIMMYQGNPIDNYNDLDELVICRITLLNECSIIFEPRLTHNGYRILSKLGEYRVLLQVWDDYLKPLPQLLDRMSLVAPIEEAQIFELPDENAVKVVCLMYIDYAYNFDYQNIWIEYCVYFPDESICTTNNTKGQTSTCTIGKDGRHHICWPIEFNVESVDISRFHIRFRIRSEDLWSRQYVAGYASLTPLLLPGKYCILIGKFKCFFLLLKDYSLFLRTDYRIECWRPIKVGDSASELHEFFIGQAIDIDFFELDENSMISRAGLKTQSSGTLQISITNIIQKQDYITRETLNYMKYGAMFGRMGIRSDLYWRIMKVLMEFEEAKRQLLLLRAAAH
ncbi:hypothetical protein DICVIV_05308 [Dictyocaulus viviparus]|uniref:Uncharacterized protein n=1 Tax=Dictyocaulus viviparus TaxID=29172 RepID=A0A0D8XXS0_DICVI|nr:hypothetical protein DICVIV_05308 [Dictyocaulus viviparus]